MRGFSIPNRGASLSLVIFFLLINVASGLYSARGISPSFSLVEITFLGAALLTAFWIHEDCRQLGIREPLDLGWFVVMAWPFSFPYHLVKTRGSKGLIIFLGLVGLFALTFLVGGLVFLLARGGGSP